MEELVGGIGAQVREVARNFNNSVQATIRAEERIAQGEPIHITFQNHPLIPALIPRMISIAEEGGKLPFMMKQIAQIYEEELEKKLLHFSTVAQPILLLILGVVIGFVLNGWSGTTMCRARAGPKWDSPATVLVKHGPFRFSRNPQYVSVNIIYIGIAISFNALWPIAFLPVVLLIVLLGLLPGNVIRRVQRSVDLILTRFEARVMATEDIRTPAVLLKKSTPVEEE